jgi:hypothetical protein
MATEVTGGTTPTRSGTTHEPMRIAALVLGVAFLAIGICGFLPEITNVDQLQFYGRHSDALLFGVFNVSVLHNLVHLAFGIAGLIMSRTARRARKYLFGGGIIYALLGLYGCLVHEGDPANKIPLNAADNWLHLGLAVLMIVLGVLLGRGVATTGRP